MNKEAFKIVYYYLNYHFPRSTPPLNPRKIYSARPDGLAFVVFISSSLLCLVEGGNRQWRKSNKNIKFWEKCMKNKCFDRYAWKKSITTNHFGHFYLNFPNNLQPPSVFLYFTVSHPFSETSRSIFQWNETDFEYTRNSSQQPAVQHFLKCFISSF